MPNISERLLFWDNKFSSRHRFTPRELMDSFRYTFNETIGLRTLKEDIKELRVKHKAPLRNERFDNRNPTLGTDEKSHYFYDANFTIAPKVMPLTGEDADRIQQAVDVLKQFRHLPHLEDLEKVLFKLEKEAQISPTKRQNAAIIDFEQVPQLRGFERLERFYRAIESKKAQIVFYKPFDGATEQLLLHPYFLKEYNNRWFVYGLNQDTEKVTPYALDRIEGLLDAPFPFRPNQYIQFDTFFKNRIGITYFEGDEIETVRLKVAQPRAQYITTKPWHESQTIEVDTPQYVVFRFDLVCNKELEAQILSFGKDIEVVEPPQLRAQIQDILTITLNNYK
jgi:predicted DNA-binding transcriptional regulator YafY